MEIGGDLSILKVYDDIYNGINLHDYTLICDAFGMAINLYNDSDGNRLTQLFPIYFIKGETGCKFYCNPYVDSDADHGDISNLPGYVNSGDDMYAKYPGLMCWPDTTSEGKGNPYGIKGWHPHFAVIGFPGIDLTRKFDLKLEWDYAKLIKAIQDGYDDKGGGWSNFTKNEFLWRGSHKDLIESLSLKVIYK